MTLGKITPDTITFERRLAAAPERVFRAWADKEERIRWDVPGDDWVIAEFSQDFKEDGVEHSRFGPKENPDAESFGRYLLIVPNRRIVSAGVMRSAKSGVALSTTMMTLEFEADGAGTLLTLIDQSVFLGEGETAEMRASGWGSILNKLERYLAA